MFEELLVSLLSSTMLEYHVQTLLGLLSRLMLTEHFLKSADDRYCPYLTSNFTLDIMVN